jgi:predicted MFS family arabinose efflux permease
MGIYLMIFMGGTPLGSPLVGLLASWLGIRATILICGIIVIIAALIVRQLYIKFRSAEK